MKWMTKKSSLPAKAVSFQKAVAYLQMKEFGHCVKKI
jgi:hypothetical protein